MMQMVNLTIDGKQIQAPAGSSVLEAARSAGIYIPTLCYHPDLRPEGACRLCMVEASGARTLIPPRYAKHAKQCWSCF